MTTPTPKKLPPEYTCLQCGKAFASASKKKYCCRKCYTSSPQFRAMIQRHIDSQRTAYASQCLVCGKAMQVTPSRAKYTCSKDCEREYRRRRFDRWIANPETIALPQNYDEFLSKDQLPCLVEGCTWVGAQLSTHMNFAHGVTATEFKQMAGFNRTQAVVTPALHHVQRQQALDRELGRDPVTRSVGVGNLTPRQTFPRSLQTREAASKGRLLKVPTRGEVTGVCAHCEKPFTYQPPAWGPAHREYCSKKCQAKAHRLRSAERDTQRAKTLNPIPCCICHQPLPRITTLTLRKVAQGIPVCCSYRCVGVLVSEIRLGKRPKPPALKTKKR